MPIRRVDRAKRFELLALWLSLGSSLGLVALMGALIQSAGQGTREDLAHRNARAEQRLEAMLGNP